jgi:hypothetical protein
MASRVIVTNHWKQYRDELEREVKRSLVQAAGAAVAAGKAKPSRYQIEHIQGNVRVDGPPRRTFRGWEITIHWPDFRANMFDKGTYQKLGRRLTARSKAGAEGNRGVRPQRFVAAARRAGKASLIASLRRNLG